MKRKGFWFEAEDEQAIATIQARYGCESESQAIRLAVRVLANSPMLAVSLPRRPAKARPPRKEPRP